MFLKLISNAETAQEVSGENVKHCMESNWDILFRIIEMISVVTIQEHPYTASSLVSLPKSDFGNYAAKKYFVCSDSFRICQAVVFVC